MQLWRTAAAVLFLCVSAFAQSSTRPLLLRDVRLIDGTGAPPVEHVSLLIQNGSLVRILKAGEHPRWGAAPPHVVPLSGKTVIPGLINGHGHLGLVKDMSVSPANYTRENVEAQLRQYERYGITTVVSLGMNADLLYQLRSEQRRGHLDGATILTADRGLGAPNGMPPVNVGPGQLYRPDTPAAARQAVNEMASRHADLIKMWVDDNGGKLPKQKPEVEAAAIDQAHKQHLRIAAHVFYQSDAAQLLADGLDILAHSVRDKALDPSTVAAIKRHGSYYIPTLQLEESFYAYAARPSWMETAFFQGAASADLSAQLASSAYRSKVANDPSTKAHQRAFQVALDNCRKLNEAGASIGFGTDSGANPFRIQGFAEHRELELMVQAGMTPLQALHSATAVNALMLGLAEHTGTLLPGKAADLVVLDDNPLDDIRNTQHIALVFHRGTQVFPPESSSSRAHLQ